MRARARAALAMLAWPALATPTYAPPPPGPGEPVDACLFARSVALLPDAPGERRLGPLRYLDGWVLTSDHPSFGSISGMVVEGNMVTALGDRGMLFRFPVPGAAEQPLRIAPLPAGPGAFKTATERDSESLQLAGDQVWVAYENSNQIWRYRLPDLEPDGNAAPALMRGWSLNRGAETLLRLADGRFLAISEDEDAAGISRAALFLGDPALAATPAVPLLVDPPAGHRITEAAQLPGGALLLLARGYTLSGGWTAGLLVGRLPDKPGAIIQTQEVATLAAPHNVDNMEALSVTSEQGRTIVWIASDDNLWGLQRTLLMKFEWLG